MTISAEVASRQKNTAVCVSTYTQARIKIFEAPEQNFLENPIRKYEILSEFLFSLSILNITHIIKRINFCLTLTEVNFCIILSKFIECKI